MKRKKAASGWIFCKRLNKKQDISMDARPTEKGDWLCKCGHWVRSDPFYHSGFFQGKEIL